MGRAEFEYDETGATFFYVALSFYALFLIPCTFFFWPSDRKEDAKHKKERRCECEGCEKKHKRKIERQPWQKTIKIVKFVGLALAWALFAVLAYKVTQIEHDHVEYDPYHILGLDREADVKEIKKAYRELSKQLHPDRGGDAEQFDNIAKAYQALTDDEARENWMKYGNPDGPKATTFGIALPKWIVSKEYGIWVLVFYGLLFMVVLPVTVGIWWYNSIKYSADKVLMDTTQLYVHFLQKTPKMEFNRMMMVLGGSFEFWKYYNKEIVERETDDVEVPRVMRELKNLGEGKKEPPLSNPYSLKARTLLHAHLSRLPLDSENLENDQLYIISKCPILVEEMLSLMVQLYFYGHVSRQPSLETIENVTRLLPMIIQAMWPRTSTLLQLPHISEYNLNGFKKQKVYSCSDLAALHESKRRAVLHSFDDQQYEDICFVLESMPRLDISANFEVKGEDDKHNVTVGSLVTLRVTLRRKPLLDGEKRHHESIEAHDAALAAAAASEQAENADPQTPQQPKRKVWEKPPQKKAKSAKAKKTAKKKKGKEDKKEETEESKKEGTEESHKEQNDNASDGEESSIEDNSDDESVGSASEKNDVDDTGAESGDEYDEDEEWAKHGEVGRKENVLETKSRLTHVVHAPYFPNDKYEWWWLYLIDKKMRKLVSPVISCKTLIDEETVEIKFPAPQQKGNYSLTLFVKSDSYVDCDYAVDVKLSVGDAPEIVLPKYEDTDEEEDDHEHSVDLSEYTEGSESDDSDQE
uniref:J domain-containing protein n=1 Tax=Steinernema glaseri TaxID=37863 RepID=A0A1I8A4C1_9BILA